MKYIGAIELAILIYLAYNCLKEEEKQTKDIEGYWEEINSPVFRYMWTRRN